ncbi:MAG TPA: nitroreductase family deazaflavin-dependent oxidoreductase [Microbacterium sp.]|uniref:nitroreductase family deazaflavin-dependent oxidoreductase n=1 Tax=Microbacterium sp. TaxID=51671 RepID=UPI002CA607E1|nr:nitroreductase family deazaflavin-dependent oxidoreductase [Microbacterium sp.]HWI30146.1 nitroreductase family deazaflavin-dependent oxidoreductase [Microbacterium sp.]
MTDANRRSGPPKALVRTTEVVALAVAGRRWIPLWAVIHHRGRRSGTAYATPIAVIPTLDRGVILIGLPWGAKTNWALNVVAAGGARIRWRGRELAGSAPRIIEPTDAATLATRPFRPIVRRMPAAIVLTRAG